jgi:hypothetical protein
MDQDNSIEDPESPEQHILTTVRNVPGLIWPTQMSKRHGKRVLVTVNAIETRRNNGVKKK